jgi:hypothetical protein
MGDMGSGECGGWLGRALVCGGRRNGISPARSAAGSVNTTTSARSLRRRAALMWRRRSSMRGAGCGRSSAMADATSAPATIHASAAGVGATKAGTNPTTTARHSTGRSASAIVAKTAAITTTATPESGVPTITASTAAADASAHPPPTADRRRSRRSRISHASGPERIIGILAFPSSLWHAARPFAQRDRPPAVAGSGHDLLPQPTAAHRGRAVHQREADPVDPVHGP